MNQERAYRCLGLLLFLAALTSCGLSQRAPSLTSANDQEALICGVDQVPMCERISAFVWGKCQCATASSP